MEKGKDDSYDTKRKGKTFYSAVPMALNARTTLALPKVSIGSLAPFASHLTLFFFGMAELLLGFRLILMILGVNGGNLLTFLFYAASYPFVFITGSAQSEIPARTLDVGVELLIIMAVYGAVWFVLSKVTAVEEEKIY